MLTRSTKPNTNHFATAKRRAMKLALPTMVSVIALSVSLQAKADAYFVANDQSFDYSGTVNGVAIPGFTSTPGATNYPGPDGSTISSLHAPDSLALEGNSNSTNFQPNWYASLNGQNDGIGNPSNSATGYVSVFDPDNSGVTSSTGTWNASHTQFTLNIIGTTPNSPGDLNFNNRVWSPTGTNTSQEGHYTNYDLSLTANFAAGTVTETNPFLDWFSTTSGPTSVTGTLNGTYVNTGSDPGTYNVALNFNNINWAGANGIVDNGTGVAPYFGATDITTNTASHNITYGTTGTSGTPTGSPVTLTNAVTTGPNAVQAAVGGDGFDGYDNGLIAGGNGGTANSSLTINGTSASSAAYGGNGGIGGTTGGNGGNATADLTLTNGGANTVGLVGAFGGYGGWGLTGAGNGGSATVNNSSVSGDVVGDFAATAGNGADNFGTGNGGNGGPATINAATVTGLAPTDPVTLLAPATGGNGGQGSGTGFAGGNGGVATINGPLEGISVSTTPGLTGSGTVTVDATQVGGNAGNGVNGAQGGTAAASTLFSHMLDDGNFAGITVNGWTTGMMNLALDATGGNGGNGDNPGVASAGAIGTASLINDQTGLIASERSATINGTATGTGGNGGNGTSGANGAFGAFGTALALITGYGDVSATANQIGGAGGGSDTGLARAGTNEIFVNTPLTADAIATSLGGGNATATSNATGGAGGSGTQTAAGAAGGQAIVINDVATNTTGNSTLNENATAGAGGNAINATAGDGSLAEAALGGFTDLTSNSLTVNLGATGGNGGSAALGGSTSGNGGNGGFATVGTNASVITALNAITLNGTATGGNGGDGIGTGFSGGAGGPAEAISDNYEAVSTGGGAVTSSLTTTGGNGGNGIAGANGGVGGIAGAFDAGVESSTVGGPLSLTQKATGGNGGSSNGGTAGAGGQGLEEMTFVDGSQATPGHASSVTANLDAIGGNGGAGTGGGTNGALGATATVGASITGFHAVNVTANATAGNGGDATGSGTFAADGTAINVNNPLTVATGLIDGISTSISPVTVSTTQTAGNGGNATGGATPGDGGIAFLRNAVTGLTPDLLTLSQTAIAGNGGNADTLNGGNGRAATSILTNTAIASVTGTAEADGGMGGNSTAANGGNGGNATANINLTSPDAANATAIAKGGATGLGGTPAIGGGAANATATATGTSGLATALAQTPGSSSVSMVQAMANGTVGSTTVANANTNIGGNVPALIAPFNAATTPNTFAFATGLPTQASVTAALVGHPNNTAVWPLVSPNSFVAGAGLLGAVFNGTTGVSHTYDTADNFTFTVPTGQGDDPHRRSPQRSRLRHLLRRRQPDLPGHR